jgi:hypothetical protein
VKRWKILLASAGILLLIGGGAYKIGWLSGCSQDAPVRAKIGAAMDTPSGWRYRQNLPHHWRYIMLQK